MIQILSPSVMIIVIVIIFVSVATLFYPKTNSTAIAAHSCSMIGKTEICIIHKDKCVDDGKYYVCSSDLNKGK